MMLYFKGASLSALLNNSIGYSCPSGFFFNRKIATVYSDAKEKMRKYFVKFGLMRTGARVSACFTN